jgi:hypothetical protein
MKQATSMKQKGLRRYEVFLLKARLDPEVRQKNCMQQKWVWLSLMVKESGSEVNNEGKILNYRIDGSAK